jgi:hypothetical protein
MRSTPSSSAAEVNAFLAKYSPEIAALGRAARRKLRGMLTGWHELIYDNYNALVFGFSPTPRPSDAVLSIALYPRWVRLFFLQDAPSLHDPERLLSGSGTRVRGLVLQSAADLDRPAVRALIAQAVRTAPAPAPRGRRTATTIRSVSAKQRPRR